MGSSVGNAVAKTSFWIRKLANVDEGFTRDRNWALLGLYIGFTMDLLRNHLGFAEGIPRMR